MLLSGGDPHTAAVLEDGGEDTSDQNPDRGSSVVSDEVDAVRVTIVGVSPGAGPHEVAHVSSEHGRAVDPLHLQLERKWSAGRRFGGLLWSELTACGGLL